jgi:hypothetical protein
VTATATDYAWFDDRPDGLSEAYCLTLARGLTAEEFLTRARARPDRRRTGVAALFEPSMALWDHYPEAGLLIGVTTAPGNGGNWALGVEVNGVLGVTEEVIVPLAAGTTVVTHFRNANATDHFYWIEDQDIRLHFEPLFPWHRQGSTPDVLAGIMQQVGFDLRDDGETPHPARAAFALAEYLTGVRLTAELLEESSYICGIAPIPLL